MIIINEKFYSFTFHLVINNYGFPKAGAKLVFVGEETSRKA
jgi:hypothetical protein